MASALGHAAILLLALTLSRAAPDDVREHQAQPQPRVIQMMYLQPKEAPPKPKPPQPVQPRRPPPPPTPTAVEPQPRPLPELPATVKATEKAPEHDEPAGSSPQPANRMEAAGAEREDAMVTEARRLFGPRAPSHGGNRGPIQAGLPVPLETGGVRCPFSGDEVQAMDRPSEGVIEGIVRAESSGRPIPGALLQVLGTGFSTFADGAGHYRLRFDPDLVDVCHTQLVRVTAPGYRTRTMLLGFGFASDNAVDLPGR